MEFPDVGYYDNRQKARVPIDRGTIKAAFGERKEQLRCECFEGMIVLTDPEEPAYINRDP